MVDRNQWVMVLLLASSLGAGCVSAHRTPAGQVSTPNGYQGSYVDAPPRTPAITTEANIQPQSSNSFSGVLKNTTGRITSSFQKMGDALAIQPKVERPGDPLSLTSRTKPFGPDMHLAAARMCEQKGNLAEANLQMEKALELDPRNRETLISLARMKHRTGALEDATRLYRQIIQMFPEDPVPHNDLGLCLARQGRIDESLAALSQAIERRPDSKLYRNNIATVLLEGGRREEALRQLAQVFEPAQAYHNLGYLCHQRGDQASAKQCFAEAQQLGASPVTQASTYAETVGRTVEQAGSPVRTGQQAVARQVHRLQQEVSRQTPDTRMPNSPSYGPAVTRPGTLPQAPLPQRPHDQNQGTPSVPRAGPFGYTPGGSASWGKSRYSGG